MNLLEVFLPIVSFIVFSLLTIPVTNIAGGKRRKSMIMLSWFIVIFTVTSIFVANLVAEYYAQMEKEPFLNLTFSRGLNVIFSSTFMIDAVSIYMAIIFTVVSAITLLYSLFYIDAREPLSGRYYALMLLITACVIGACFSGDFLTLFIFWEASAVGSGFLMLYKESPRSIHATLKYLIMIIIASAFIVYGLSIIYGLAGTLNFWAVKQILMSLKDKHLFILSFIFMATGYAIESAIVPFHMWLPDAYTAAPASSSAFLSALVDQGSYYVLLRILVYILTPPTILDWRIVLAFLSIFSMILGNLLALIEHNIKRLIAYVCIADVGYNLIAITSVTPLGVMGNLYFFLVGGLTTALSFMTVGILNNIGIKTLGDLSGIGRKMPLTSLALLTGAFSFSGFPPFAGFFAKYLVFTAAIEAGLSWLAIVGVLTSIVQAAYFLRLVNYMFAKKTRRRGELSEPKNLLIPVFMLTIMIIFLGIYPTIILELIKPVVQQITLII